MKRIVHVWLCVALAQCQPVPAAEMETDAKGTILRLSEAEALSCGSEQGCNLYTEAAIKRIRIEEFRAGYLKAVQDTLRKASQCGRDA
jgi:hypothetical protein